MLKTPLFGKNVHKYTSAYIHVKQGKKSAWLLSAARNETYKLEYNSNLLYNIFAKC